MSRDANADSGLCNKCECGGFNDVLMVVQVGDRITGGDVYALVQENSLLEHRVMLPPTARGNISFIAPAGEYNIDEKVIEVEFQGTKKVQCIITWCSKLVLFISNMLPFFSTT